MTRAFVHGVPETASIWDDLRAALGEDSVALSLPGFGTPRPSGFGATMDDYAGWLLDELGRLDAPVDVVGHDWGGMLTSRIATTHPEVIRSYVTDAVNPLDPSFEWHDLAKLWQTPGEGEAFWEALAATPDDNAAMLETLGVPAPAARAMAAALDDTMAACILDLYRSAPDIGNAWASDGPVDRPGLVVVPADDPYSDIERVRPKAERFGATVTALPGVGHFWPAQAPDAGAAAITAFWATLD